MGLILPSLRDRFRFPAGAARLNRNHPLAAGGALRSAPVALSGGGMRDLYSGAFAAAAESPAVIQTKFGPAVATTVLGAKGYYFAPILAGEIWTQFTYAAIFLPTTAGAGQSIIADASTASPGAKAKLTIVLTSGVAYAVTLFDNVNCAQVPLTLGHAYFLILGYHSSGLDSAPNKRITMSALDLVTGQVQVAYGSSTFTPAVGDAYAFLVNGNGATTDRHALMAGAISTRALNYGEQMEVLSDPWALWYDHANGVESLMATTALAPTVVAGAAPTVIGIFRTPVAGALASGDTTRSRSSFRPT